MGSSTQITVVYIMWIPLGNKPFDEFIDSYCNFAAGVAHDVVIVFKGNEEEIKHIEQYQKKLSDNNIKYKALFHSEGLDIDTYLFSARQIQTPLIFFINTRSLILAENWLKKYADHFNTNNAGIVSATGSYQSYYTSVMAKNSLKWESGYGVKYNFRKYKLLLKAFFYWRFLFKPFPNPHVRTNTFMIKRDIFLQIKKPVIKQKIDAYKFESGRNSITVQVMRMRYNVLLLDRYGKTYTIPEWPNSNTFWKGSQENLLISDNQTRLYEQADETNKKLMTKLAWGINE